MDFRNLEDYIIEIDNEKNITKAAARLGISQSALNQQLLKLEKELGTPLFIRSRGALRPTPAGRIYLDGARQIRLIRTDTARKIQDAIHTSRHQLKIGLNAGRFVYMFTEIYPELHRQYPEMDFRPVEMSLLYLQPALADGTIDLGFVTITEDAKAEGTYEKIREEELVVLVPSDDPVCREAVVSRLHPRFPEIDLRLLRDREFVLMLQNTVTGSLVSKCFESAGFTPKTVMETTYSSDIPALARSFRCCGIVNEYAFTSVPEGYRAFSLTNHPRWDFCIIYRSNAYLTEPARSLIRLVKERWGAGA